MKYRYDKALRQLVEQHEKEREEIIAFPVSTEIQELVETMEALRRSIIFPQRKT